MGDPKEMAHEVNVLCDLKSIDDTYKTDKSEMPCILSYGFLALRNYKMVSNTELGDDNCPSFGYIIMNAYQFTLESFLEENH